MPGANAPDLAIEVHSWNDNAFELQITRLLNHTLRIPQCLLQHILRKQIAHVALNAILPSR